jgi:hypothetical protein
MDNSFLRRWLAGFWLSLAGLAAVIWLMRLAAVLDPEQGPYYVTTGFEDISVFNFSRMRYGDPVYVDCFEYPYRMSLFNWLFYWLYGRLVAAVNPSEVMLPTVLRLVTLAWALLGCAAMVRFLHKSGPEAAPALPLWANLGLAIVTWFGPTIGWWSLTVRPDVPAVACAYLGLLLVLRSGGRLSSLQELGAGFLFFLAWSFKQSEVFVFAGTMLALLCRRQWGSFCWIGATFAVFVAVVLVNAPPAYFTNLLAPGVTPVTGEFAGVVLEWCLRSWMPLLLVGLVVFLLGLDRSERQALWQSHAGFFLSVVGAVALIGNLILVRRPGASGNYLFETWVVGMTLTGLIQQHAAATLKTFATPARQPLFVAATGIVLVWSVFCMLALFEPLDKPDTAAVELMLRLPHEPYSESLLDEVRTSPRPMLIDDPGLVRLALGKESDDVPVVDHTIYWDARTAGKLSHPDINAKIAAHEYVNIWLYRHNSWWEPEVKKAGYVVFKEDGAFRQYRRPITLAALPRKAASGSMPTVSAKQTSAPSFP